MNSLKLENASKALDLAAREFTVALVEAMKYLPEEVKGWNFEVDIRKSFYSDSAPLISYGASANNCGSVTGNMPDVVVRETLRRMGWNEAHKPMVLISGPTVEEQVQEETDSAIAGPIEFDDVAR